MGDFHDWIFAFGLIWFITFVFLGQRFRGYPIILWFKADQDINENNNSFLSAIDLADDDDFLDTTVQRTRFTFNVSKQPAL